MTTWTATKDKLPDDEMAVLLSLSDGEVWPGFREAGKWYYVSADPVGVEVWHWAEFPSPPGAGPEPWPVSDPSVDQTRLNDITACLRDLLATIELQTDCMDNTIERATLDPYIERAEDLLGESLEDIIK